MKKLLMVLVLGIVAAGCATFCEYAPTVGYETGVFCDSVVTPVP